MDRGNGRTVGLEVGFHQINGATYCLDPEGNWFLRDATSGEWLLCAQAESAQQNHTTPFGDTRNGAMSSLPGNSRGVNRSVRHQGQGSGRPSNAQILTGDPDSRPVLYQSQYGTPADPFVNGMAIVVDRPGNEPETDDAGPSSTDANPGSWDSIAESTMQERDVIGPIAIRGVSNHQVQRGYHHPNFGRFVGPTRDPSEASRTVAVVNQRFPPSDLSRQRSRNPAPVYPATVVLSSDSSTSESESQENRLKSKPKSKPRDKSAKGSPSKKRR